MEKVCQFSNDRASLGERCGGFDESTGDFFLDCEEGLECGDSGQPSIPGAHRTCQLSKQRAQLGENCGGHDENTGRPFPDCVHGLVC